MTYVAFEFNNVFKIFNNDNNIKRIRQKICPKLFGETVPSNILFCMKVVFNDSIEYPLRYISTKNEFKKSENFENILYITANIRYIRSIKIILKDPTDQAIITSGSAVLHFETK